VQFVYLKKGGWEFRKDEEEEKARFIVVEERWVGW
jgi:hypothetical protein